MGPFKGEVPVFARLWPIRVSFMTGAVWSAILATAGLLVLHVTQYPLNGLLSRILVPERLERLADFWNLVKREKIL